MVTELLPSLMQRKIQTHCFLNENDVNFHFAEKLVKLESAASAPKPTNIPNKSSHLETMDRTHAWRAAVFLRLVLGPIACPTAEDFFLGTGR